MLANTSRSHFSIEALLDPSAFPHEVSEIQLMETHISWVVLTGPFAYKIKKPVHFDFVDYSTLQRRKLFCEMELKLNRRFAPGLYLDVVPIFEREGRLMVGSDCSTEAPSPPERQPVEYAVKMEEFPQDAVVSARLHHPELTGDQIERFGIRLAQFHETIESATPQRDCVQLGHLKKDALENFDAVHDAVSVQQRDEFLNPLKLWTLNEFEKLKPKFQSRLNGGMVRLCHGDLHLRNIVQFTGKLIPFDGIEFNEEFQWIDLLSEISFPVMDFVARGRPDLGWRLLNAYLEAAGDYEDLDVLRFYLVYRSLVRAKVTWLNPKNHLPPPAGADSNATGGVPPSEAPWLKYFSAAQYFAFELRPTLSITHGFSGSGKSTAAMQILEQSGGIRIRSDVERQRLADKFKTRDKYSPEMTNWVYSHLLELCELAIKSGFPVVIDGTFLKQSPRSMFRQLAERLDVEFLILDCDAPVEELQQRIRRRGHDPSEATLDVLAQQMESHDPLTTEELQFVRKIQP